MKRSHPYTALSIFAVVFLATPLAGLGTATNDAFRAKTAELPLHKEAVVPQEPLLITTKTINDPGKLEQLLKLNKGTYHNVLERFVALHPDKVSPETYKTILRSSPKGLVHNVAEHIERCPENTMDLLLKEYPLSARKLTNAAAQKLPFVEGNVLKSLGRFSPDAHATLLDAVCKDENISKMQLEPLEKVHYIPYWDYQHWHFHDTWWITRFFRWFKPFRKFVWNNYKNSVYDAIMRNIDNSDKKLLNFFRRSFEWNDISSSQRRIIAHEASRIKDPAILDDELVQRLISSRDVDDLSLRAIIRNATLQKLQQLPSPRQYTFAQRFLVAKLQARYNHCSPDAPLSLFQESCAQKSLMTPTESHMLAVGEQLGTMEKYYNMAEPCLAELATKVNILQEIAQEQNKPYYSYVHAQHWSLDIAQRVYEDLHPQATNCFFPIHFLTVAEQKISPQRDKELVKILLERGNCSEGCQQRHLLSLNSPFFGNIADIKTWEATAEYFVSNKSWRPPSEPLKLLLAAEGHKDLYDAYAQEIEQLQKLHAAASQYGKLWVILVPQEIHQQLVYVSRARGYKRTVAIDGKETDDVNVIQETLCTRPDAIADIDTLQFRMLMTPSTGLNPDTGIKTIPLHCADPVKYAEFEMSFKELMTKIKADIAAKKQGSIISPDPQELRNS